VIYSDRFQGLQTQVLRADEKHSPSTDTSYGSVFITKTLYLKPFLYY